MKPATAARSVTCQMSSRVYRLPHIIPTIFRRRIEIETTALYDFVERAAASISPAAWVLDAGAGEGRYRQSLHHTRYVGVDLLVGDVDWNYADLDIVCNLTRLPFPVAQFDAVLCTQVLEHVTEPLNVLQEIQRVLKLGGHLYLTAPQSWHQHQKPHDYYRYTSFGLRYLFEQAGLQVESIQSMGGYFWFLSYQLQNINFWLFPRGMRGRWVTWPLRAIFGVIFQLIFPLLLYHLDKLDRTRDETLGYTCIAIKPNVPT